jgi:hypothetical protein
MSQANRCHNAGIPADEAERLLANNLNRPPTPANEIQTTVAKAYRCTWTPSGRPAAPFKASRRAPVPLTEIHFDLDKLKAVAERITPPRSWCHWLWERSPKRPEAMNAFSFLAHLYRAGEIVLTFDEMESKTPVDWVKVTQPMDCRVPAPLRSGGRYGRGVWFLCNPVDGKWHDTGELDARGKPHFSCRNHQAITSWRYAVLESDQVPADLWLAFVAQLPVRTSAIYTSGSRSVHCLIRLDAASKAEWDGQVAPLKRPLKVMGADSGALSAVRLTRLPGCWRPEKNGFQRLLYLCPNPPAARLLDLPVIRSRFEALDRWRNICPRWNQNQEAYQ